MGLLDLLWWAIYRVKFCFLNKIDFQSPRRTPGNWKNVISGILCDCFHSISRISELAGGEPWICNLKHKIIVIWWGVHGLFFLCCFHCTYSYCQLNKFSSIQGCLNNRFILSSSLFLLACGNHNTEEWKYMSTAVITQWILIWTDIVRHESMALSNWKKKSINKTSSTFSASDNGHIPGFSTSSGISLKNSILSFYSLPVLLEFPIKQESSAE